MVYNLYIPYIFKLKSITSLHFPTIMRKIINDFFCLTISYKIWENNYFEKHPKLISTQMIKANIQSCMHTGLEFCILFINFFINFLCEGEHSLPGEER